MTNDLDLLEQQRQTMRALAADLRQSLAHVEAAVADVEHRIEEARRTEPHSARITRSEIARRSGLSYWWVRKKTCVAALRDGVTSTKIANRVTYPRDWAERLFELGGVQELPRKKVRTPT